MSATTWQTAIAKVTTYGRDVLTSVAVGWLSVTTAAVLNHLIPGLGLETHVAFFLGFFSTAALLAFWLAGGGRFEAELTRLKRLRDANLITEALYQRLVERAAAWYAARRFGGPLPDAVVAARPSQPRRPTSPIPKPAPPAEPEPPVKG